MYPGIGSISRKNQMARNLMRMAKHYPEQYNFFPKTWVLPSDSNDLRNFFAANSQNPNNHKVTYIVKPDGMSQGKGIFLSRNFDHIIDITSNRKENVLLEDNVDQDKIGYVVQQYLDRPHLVEGLKYDLRIYVMLYGINPLRIYLHKMAFARFCTEPYQKPDRDNLKNCFMHLTNYAINKHSDNYQDCDADGDAGHKRSLGAILQILKNQGCDTAGFMQEVKEIIVKTIIAGQPELSHLYRSC